MPLSKQHKLRSRERIIREAGKLFRAKGFRGVSIDTIMSAAKMTRGGFYAHFSSKADLFAEVIRSDHDLLEKLEARVAEDSNELDSQARRILQDYLAPEHFAKIAHNCTLAALSADVLKAGDQSRQAFNEALQRFYEQLLPEPGGGTSNSPWPTIAMTIGAMSIARVMVDPVARDELLKDCQLALENTLQ